VRGRQGDGVTGPLARLTPSPLTPTSGEVRLSDGERQSPAEIGKKLGRQALEEIATIVKPDTILAWHRTLVAQKFNGSQQRNAPGRPPMTQS